MKFVEYIIAMILLIVLLVAEAIEAIRNLPKTIRNRCEIRAGIKAARKAEREEAKLRKQQKDIGNKMHEILVFSRAYSENYHDWYIDCFNYSWDKTYLIKVLKVKNLGRYNEKHHLFLTIQIDLRKSKTEQVYISIPYHDPLWATFYGYYSTEQAMELLRLKLIPVINGPAW